MVLKSIFSYSEKDKEGRVFKLTVYEVLDDPYGGYIIRVSKGEKGEVSARHLSLDSVLSQLKLYGDDIYKAFVEKVKERFEDVDEFSTNTPEAQKDVLMSLAIHDYYAKKDIRPAPLPGDIVEDIYSKRLGVVEYIEYIGANHFPIYQVRWEDGSRSTRITMQLRVVKPREELEIAEIDFDRIKEEILNGRTKPLDKYVSFKGEENEE